MCFFQLIPGLLLEILGIIVTLVGICEEDEWKTAFIDLNGQLLMDDADGLLDNSQKTIMNE